MALFLLGAHHAAAEVRALKLYNTHTEEQTTIVFKRDGVYDQAGLAQINRFLRDWRKNEPTKMDPHLLDLVWEAYRLSGSRDYIHVVSGYRSPATNAMLRSQSSAVAENSLHMAGKAMDFYLPDVRLSKMREIGLVMQSGGVGYYPTSGSPFIHLDTGSVRHWPRMTRQQLAQVFPNGGTLHIPSDGKPLPGYSEALVAYNARKAADGGIIAVARAAPPAAAAEPMVLASAVVPLPTRAPRADGLTVAGLPSEPPPMPRLAPHEPEPAAFATAFVAYPGATQGAAPAVALASFAPATFVSDVHFGPPQSWTVPDGSVALAERAVVRPSASGPIASTAVVATVDVDRPLRAAAITNAVLNANEDRATNMPLVLAYAPLGADPTAPTSDAAVAGGYQSAGDHSSDTLAPDSAAPESRLYAPALTMTALDAEDLRTWMGPGSTRQMHYAQLTMPDFSKAPELIDKPTASYGTSFGRVAYGNLRTDHFVGPAVVQPVLIDLSVTGLATR